MAKKPHFFPNCGDIKYESGRERLGVAIMTTQVASGRVGKVIATILKPLRLHGDPS